MTRSLDGIVVVDFSRILAGPYASMLLGDLGASVIKVERPGMGDESRSWGPPFASSGMSAYYLSVNRNKRSIDLDLGRDKDFAIARELVTNADIVLENFRPGVMESFGLGYEKLREWNPGIVFCSITGFGSHVDVPGYDFLVQAASGLMSVTGDPNGEAFKTGVAIVDVVTGLHAVAGVLAAVHERERSGIGQRVDVNLFLSALSSLVNQASNFLVGGEAPKRMGNRHPNIAPYEVVRTASDPIAIAVGNNRQFERLSRAIAQPSMAREPRWRNNANRVANRETLVARIEDSLSREDAEHWLRVLRENSVPCGPINSIPEALRFAREIGNEPMVLTSDSGDDVPQIASPIKLSRTPVDYGRTPPRLGEHRDEVLAWLKGLASTNDGSVT